jgi:hypothetical protein
MYGFWGFSLQVAIRAEKELQKDDKIEQLRGLRIGWKLHVDRWEKQRDNYVTSWCLKWRCRGSNPRPSDCGSDALPLSYIPGYMKLIVVPLFCFLFNWNYNKTDQFDVIIRSFSFWVKLELSGIESEASWLRIIRSKIPVLAGLYGK